MMAVLISSSVFAIPAWVQGSLLVGMLGLSAVLSGGLSQRPKIQRYVTALALAFLLAMAVIGATKANTSGRKVAPIINCDYFWFTLECWLLS
jgi:hypothetical protein